VQGHNQLQESKRKMLCGRQASLKWVNFQSYRNWVIKAWECRGKLWNCGTPNNVKIKHQVRKL